MRGQSSDSNVHQGCLHVWFRVTDQAELIQCSVWQTLPNLAAIVSCHYDSDLIISIFHAVAWFFYDEATESQSFSCLFPVPCWRGGTTFTCVTINGWLFLFERMSRFADYNLDNVEIARKQITIAVIFVDSQQKRKLKNDYWNRSNKRVLSGWRR